MEEAVVEKLFIGTSSAVLFGSDDHISGHSYLGVDGAAQTVISVGLDADGARHVRASVFLHPETTAALEKLITACQAALADRRKIEADLAAKAAAAKCECGEALDENDNCPVVANVQRHLAAKAAESEAAS